MTKAEQNKIDEQKIEIKGDGTINSPYERDLGTEITTFWETIANNQATASKLLKGETIYMEGIWVHIILGVFLRNEESGGVDIDVKIFSQHESERDHYKKIVERQKEEIKVGGENFFCFGSYSELTYYNNIIEDALQARKTFKKILPEPEE